MDLGRWICKFAQHLNSFRQLTHNQVQTKHDWAGLWLTLVLVIFALDLDGSGLVRLNL